MKKISQSALLGGDPVRTDPVLPRKTMGKEEEDAVVRVMRGDTLSAFLGGAGPFFRGGIEVQKFEDAWAEREGFKHAISVNSWTSGLVASVGAAEIGPGDEVICSPYTMSASATCALFYGGIPVFADIDPVSLCLSPASIRQHISPRTKAIIVVHLLGHPADMDEIMKIAEEFELIVIEDAAQAPGVLYKGKPVGAIGHLGGFSLNFHKHIHTGEGGMIVTNDDELAERCRLIRNHGENAVDTGWEGALTNVIGGNYRLTELQAAIGSVQLTRLDGYLETRQELASYLRDGLADLPGITMQPAVQDGSTHAYYIFPIFFDASESGIPRNLFIKAVLSEFAGPAGGESVPLTGGYVKPLYWSRIYQELSGIGRSGFPFNQHSDPESLYREGRCPVAEQMYRETLLLSPLVREPLGHDVMDDLVLAVTKTLDNTSALNAAFPDEQPAYTPMVSANQTDVR